MKETTTNTEQGGTKRVKRSESWLKKLWSTKRGKAAVIAVCLTIIITIVMAIPVTRYGVTSWAIKKDVTFTVVSSTDKSPVSNATVKLGDVTAQTDETGKASMTVPVGIQQLVISKKYYSDYEATYTVPLVMSPENASITLITTGRQLNIVVTDTISKSSVPAVTIKTLDTSAKTNVEGLATVVVPVTTKDITLSLTATGYNDIKKTIKLTDKDDYTVSITKTGFVYYLSKASGEVDVKKAHLDGSDATVVLKATGTESDYTTSLLSSRDWAYSALTANRDDTNGIYLISAKDDSMTTIDTGDASFSPIGWNGHKFYFGVSRNDHEYWEAKGYAIKVYDADQDKLTIIDENKAKTVDGSTLYQTFTSAYILQDELVYGRYWNNDYYYGDSLGLANEKSELVSVSVASNQASVKKTFPAANLTSFNLVAYEPGGVYIRTSGFDGSVHYYEYENGTVTEKTGINDSKFFSDYPSYLVSPNAKKVFWYEERDGKNYLFTADAEGKNQTTLAESSDFKSYGWFTDEYLLLSKNGSELYVAPVSDISKSVKVTDYHKAQGVGGYGYGYGGVY